MLAPLTVRGWETYVSDDKRTRVEVYSDLATGLIERIVICERTHFGDSWGPTIEVHKVA